MTEFNISDMMSLLTQFGISPDQLGPDKFNKVMELTSNISDPSQITPEVSRQIMRTLGIAPRAPVKTKTSANKIGRNDPCPCNSGKKWKKCCLLSNK